MTSWDNPTTNLWYVTTPTPGVITFDGSYYYLLMSGIPNFRYHTSTLSDAQNQYVLQATALLSAPINLNSQLLSLTPPTDGLTILVYLGMVDGTETFAIGTWNNESQTVTVAAQTIPASSVQFFSFVSTNG